MLIVCFIGSYEDGKATLPLALRSSDLEDGPRVKRANRQNVLPDPPSQSSSPCLGLVNTEGRLEDRSDLVDTQTNSASPSVIQVQETPLFLANPTRLQASSTSTSTFELLPQPNSSVCPIVLDNEAVISAVCSAQCSGK